MISRNKLTDELTGWLGESNQGYFISLNTKVTLTGLLDPRFENEMHKMNVKVQKLMIFLKEYCFGRKYLRQPDHSSLKGVIGYEVGADKGKLHAHIVATHRGDTDRSIENVNEFMHRKWCKLMEVELHDDSLSHVEFIDVVRDRVWYLTKQVNALHRWQGASSIDLA